MQAKRSCRSTASHTTGTANRFGMNLRTADQASCAAILVVSLTLMAITWIYQGGLRGRLIDIEKAVPQPIPYDLDINQSQWQEWSVLPGIGEKIAQRIVESRRTQGPFRSHDELTRVRGIGPRTVERIRPYLRPIHPRSKPGSP